MDPLPPALAQTDRRTAHEAVLETLRAAIVGGELTGGTRVVQADLARQLGTSTTPVREAIRDLVAEGLLEFDRYRGAIVHRPTPGELNEIYAMRTALEPLAMREAAARIRPGELDAAAELIAAMDRTDDVATFVNANRRFHEVVSDAARLPRLAAVLKTLRDTSAIYVGASLRRDPHLMRRTNAEHVTLLEALRERDAEQAARLIVAHLHNTVDEVGGDAR